jgi:hypothetical protein
LTGCFHPFREANPPALCPAYSSTVSNRVSSYLGCIGRERTGWHTGAHARPGTCPHLIDFPCYARSSFTDMHVIARAARSVLIARGTAYSNRFPRSSGGGFPNPCARLTPRRSFRRLKSVHSELTQRSHEGQNSRTFLDLGRQITLNANINSPTKGKRMTRSIDQRSRHCLADSGPFSGLVAQPFRSRGSQPKG